MCHCAARVQLPISTEVVTTESQVNRPKHLEAEGTKRKTNLKDLVNEVAKPWDNSPYYENAEKLIYIFWGDKSEFIRLFEKLDLTKTLELACGHGRHAEIVQPMATELILMDVFQDNLDVCKKRLYEKTNVDFIFGNGYSFEPAEDASLSAIYCYDAMVHFAPKLVEMYIKDTARVLSSGGMALFHHSNFDAPTDQSYGKNPHARNKMTRKTFNNFVSSSGLEIVEAFEMDWGQDKNLDGVTLLRKP